MAVGRAEVEFAFGCACNGLFHIEIRIVGVDCPPFAKRVVALHLKTVIMEVADVLVQHSRAARIRCCCNHIFAVNNEYVCAKSAVGSAFEICEFVVHHTLGFEFVVVGRKHVHISDYRIGESFGNQQLDILCVREMEYDAALWYNLRTHL